MTDPNVNVSIKANVGNFLRGLLSAEAAFVAFKKGLKDFTVASKGTQNQQRILTNELNKQARAARSLTFQYGAMRKALLSLAVRTAIVSFTALVASMNSVIITAGVLTASMVNLGGAMGTGFTAGLTAATQGLIVFSLAFKGVGHALTTTGKLHETAMEKLTKPAKDFVNEIIDIRKASRDLQLTAQKGLFPGVTRGLRDAAKLMPVFKQAIWDTSQALGYLAERAGEMVEKRGKLLGKFFATNTRTIMNMGEATEDFAAGFLEVFTAATPLIDHMTKGVAKFADTFKDKTKDWRKDGQLSAFFKDLRKTYDNWTSILGTTGKMLFDIFKTIQPVVHQVEKSIKSSVETANEWVGAHRPQIKEYFEESLKPMGAFLKAFGRLAETWVKFSNAGNKDAVRFFDAFRTKIIPLLENWFIIMDEKILPKVADLTGALLDFLRDATPGFEGLIGLFGHIAGGLTLLLKGLSEVVKFGNQFGSIGSAIATAFSVTALIVGWKGLKSEISTVVLLMRKFLGFAPHDTPVSKMDLLRKAPFVPTARTIYASGRQTATRVRDRSQYITERGRGIGAMGGGPVRRGLRNAWNDENPIQDLWMMFGPGNKNRPWWPPEQDPWHPNTTRKHPAMTTPQLPMYTGARFIAPSAEHPYQDRKGRWHAPGGAFMKVTQDEGGQWRTSGGRFIRSPIAGGAEDRGQGQRPKPAPYLRLKGGEAAAMMKTYEDEMEKSTKRGFLKGIRGAKGGLKGGGGMGGSAGSATARALSGVGGAVFPLLMLAPLLEPLIKKLAAEREKTTTKIAVTGTQLRAGLNPAARRIQQQRGDSSALGDQIDSKRISGFADAIDKATRDNNVQRLHKLARGLDSVAGASKNMDTHDKLKTLAKDVHALAAEKSQKTLDDLKKGFENLDMPVADSIDHIRDRLALMRNDIGNKMPFALQNAHKGVNDFDRATANAFGNAAQSIQAAMDSGVISVKKGMREMERLLTAQFKTLGFTKEQAKHLAQTGDISGKTDTSGGKQGAAVGGFFLGNKGERGRDTIPMNIGGEKIIAGRGEYVGIFNGQQQQAFDQMAAETGHGSMEGFFAGNARPHYMAKGGVVGKAGLIRLGHKLENQGFDVGENPAFGGVHPVHVKNSLHYSGDALDINADNMRGGEKANLDRLSARLIKQGWHVLWQVPGHFDHLHVDDAGGGGSVGDITPQLPKIKIGGPPGLLKGLVGGELGMNRAVSQALLDSAAGSAGSGDTGNYKTGKGILSRAQIAGLMRAHGFPNDQIATGVAVALAESGGNPNIANSIGATGLWQILLSAHPDISGAEARDPNKATAYAHKLWKQSGWQPWEAYTGHDGRGADGPYLHYLHQAFGGTRAAAGLARESVARPKPSKPPKNDPVGEAPHDNPKKKKPKKKPYTHSTPMPGGTAVGGGRFKPKSKKPKKPKPRKSVQKLIDGGFNFTDLNLDNAFDPITGESLDVTKAFFPFQAVTKYDKYIEGAQGRLSILQGQAGLTVEEAIENLYNSKEYPDLTNYLKSQKKDPVKWMAENGDSLDVVNVAGMTVQGKPIRGILQAVAEIDQQLAVEQSEHLPYGLTGGIYGAMKWQRAWAKSVNTKGGIKERRSRLVKIRRAFQANVKLRARLKKKMNHAKKKSYTWRDAVRHNKGLITEMQHWKRDNVGETPGATRTADHQIDYWRSLNEKLTHDKPKGTDADGAYQHDLAVFKQRGVENKLLVGATDAKTWSISGDIDSEGAAGLNMFIMQRWKEADDFKQQTLTTLKTSIPSEKLNIDTLKTSRQEWTGTAITPPPIDTSQADADKDRLIELKKQQGIEALTAALLGSTQFGALKGFAQLLGQRYVGAYAHGGLIGETGMALVHKGETIRPDPNGPFGTRGGGGDGGGGAPIVQVDLVLKDRAGQLVELVDQRVRIVAPSTVSRSTGQRTRVLRSAPGGR